MRLIWTTELTAELHAFRSLLDSKGIETLAEEIIDSNWDSDNYNIRIHKLWIYDEDRLEEAKTCLQEFLKNPPPVAPAPQKPISIHHPKRRPPMHASKVSLTNLLIFVCSALFLICMWTERPIQSVPPQLRNQLLLASPAEKALLYDYPESYELIDKIGALYGYDTLLAPTKLPPAGKFLYNTYLHTATWDGFYPMLVERSFKPIEQASLFEKIRTGEIWRLVTPIFLHSDLLHLFFNMAWLLLLGVEIERHLSTAKFLLLIVLSAIISNTAQYLMSGCAFIGFSGVVCAIAFFIYSRQKIAPWEGYHLPRATLQFLLFFICGIAALSLIAFGLEFFSLGVFPIQIANTAHLVGAGVGLGMGRLRFFKSRL